MSVPGLVVALVLLAAMMIMVIPPLFEREKPKNDAAVKQQERLLTDYNRVLTNIRDLDEDRATGKINEADYQAEREMWMQRGIQVLEGLDETAAESDPAADGAVDPVEQAVTAYREKKKNEPTRKRQ